MREGIVHVNQTRRAEADPASRGIEAMHVMRGGTPARFLLREGVEICLRALRNN
jgi:hypothetical protein